MRASWPKKVFRCELEAGSNFLEISTSSKILEGSKNPSYTTLCNAARNFAVLAVAALAFVLAEGP